MSEPRLIAGGTSYRDVGQGEAMVFIHGVGLNADAWEPQIGAFSKMHRVIAIDLPGHGSSKLPEVTITLDDYVKQLTQLLDDLGVAAANIVGHSMGGLVAIGFALAHPSRCLRLAVLNSVYQRSDAQRTAVMARAQEILSSKSVGDIEQPLERWFGSRDQQSALANDVRKWLRSVSPDGYAAAYRVFAGSDTAFAGKLGTLSMPALFATGSLDPNSSPTMSQMMVGQMPRAKVTIIDGARHMMNLTHASETNSALQELLKMSAQTIDIKDLRNAFGAFMTGVTIVTTKDAKGGLRGFTANSFASVSLEPPLLLVCLNRSSSSAETFSTSGTFAVNILSESQQVLSGIFASRRPDKFADASFTESISGNPLFGDVVAWFDCTTHQIVDAGDHLILIGRVTSYAYNNASALGYARGGYFTLGLEQSAINAASHARTEIGVILECKGKLLAYPAADGKYDLPHVGRQGEAGSTSRLVAILEAQGIKAKLGFLFAVYENNINHTQSIYYRGECENAGTATLLDFENLPFDKFRDDATRAMVQRYCAERLEGRYKVYSGNQVSGDVRDVSGV